MSRSTAVAATAVGVFRTQQAAVRIQSQLGDGRLEKRNVEFPRTGTKNLSVPLVDGSADRPGIVYTLGDSKTRASSPRQDREPIENG
jgi:hypothetical protein